MWFLVLVLMFSVGAARAQWLTQSFTLKPGWNAIFTHVDASYQSLDALLPDANGPVAEIWLWKPTFSTAQFIDTPYADAVANYQWAVWTSARGDTDTLMTLVGNAAYLINNRTAADYVWTVKGRPVPPVYQWTTTGLNFLGFPTPANSAPNFATYLAPAPDLDLAKTLQNSARVFRYPGGNLGESNPSEVVSFTASTTPVSRGQAYWVRGSTNYYNRYYGPVEVSLQNPDGILFRDTLGTYSLRLKNLTSIARTVTFDLLPSEQPPLDQPAITAMPQLLIRGALSPTTLTYEYTVLAGQSFTLTPQGQAGSELQVVLGLNRSAMTAPPGSLYAGILRIADTSGLQQTDVPVSASVASASGLWVGQASINQVGQYLKSYPKVDVNEADQTAQINAAAAQANLPPNGAEMPGAEWLARETNVSRTYSAVASSLDGRTVVAAATGGALYVSQDYGTTWVARDSNRNWAELACSADGSVMAATVFNGPIYVSTDYGSSWVATPSGNQAWVGIACSANGNLLAAVVQNGSLYTSSNRGATWVARSSAGVRNWSSITMSADGSRLLAAVNPGQLYTSADGGTTWLANAQSTSWTGVGSSSDGIKLVAVVDGGEIYTSTDAGTNWTARGVTDRWSAVTSSTDGQRLAATAKSGQIYSSEDAGVTWAAREQNRNWDDIVSSGDATRLVAVVNGGAIYTLSRAFASYTVDPATGLVQDQNGLYLSTGVNTNMAKVANAFPLRLILHNNSEEGANEISLLQRVYVGPGKTTTNTLVASRESLLDPGQLASARRITATHLPFTMNNTVWTASGVFNPGSVVIFTVAQSYKDQASNPFLHTFHPNHDNLDANFKTVLPRGIESYDITRTIRLTFSSPGTDFASLTASAQSRGGTYEETMTIGGRGAFTRDFRFSGSFTLQLISPVATLTTQ
ncbi:MAG: hypothetical protein AB1813_01460 [Verrucomicrobiota bacterium]